jgi:antitoxin (DNA-binding transcriptional repressor) of toxin-antitoxin stability system
MTTVTLSQAAADLIKLIDAVETGGEVTILRGGKAVAKLVRAPQPRERQPGRYKGKFTVPPSFFYPLPREELEAWGEVSAHSPPPQAGSASTSA